MFLEFFKKNNTAILAFFEKIRGKKDLLFGGMSSLIILNKGTKIIILNGCYLQCVITNKSDDKITVRSRLEDSAVDY